MAHVLVVDDDSDIREVFRESLIWAGHTAAVVASLATARALVSLNRPDIVILDLHFIDGGDAIAFANEVRATLEVPILACSGHPDHLDRAMATDVFTRVIPKPCDVLEMVRAVTEIAPA